MDQVATIVVAVGTAVQALTVLIAAIFAGYQVKSSTDARYFEGIYRVYQEFDSEEARKQRHAVYALPDVLPPGTNIGVDEVELIKSVINRYDFVGHLILTGILPEDYVVPVYYLQVVRVWTKVQPYIRYIQETRGLGRTYTDRFARLYKMCENYRKHHNPHSASVVGANGIPIGSSSVGSNKVHR